MPDELSPDERAELERLRDEVAALRRKRTTWRTIVSAILITLGCMLVPVSVVAVWAANQVADTDRYVQNVAPLAKDPAIQQAAANRVSTELMKAIDLPALLDQAVGALKLPPKLTTRLEGLTGPLAGGVQNFVRQKVGEVVASDTFDRVWVEANRVAHTQLNAVLTGEGSKAVKVAGNTVSLDLGPIIARVKQRLVDAGLGIAANIPEIHPTIELFSSPDLVKWQNAYQLLLTLKWALPITALILIVLGVYVARSHRRALIGAGLGIAIGMIVLAAGLALGHSLFISAVAERGLNTAAATSLYDTVVRFMRDGLRMLAVLGLVIAMAGFFTGPSVTAVRTRGAITSGINWVRSGTRLNTGRFGEWLYRNRTLVRVAVVALAAVVFVFWDHPTGKAVLLLTVLTLVVLGVVELLARPSSGVST